MQKLDLADQLTTRLQTVLDTVEREFQPLTTAQLTWKPAPDRWSVVECLQHLNLAERFYIRNLQHKADQLGLVQHRPTDQPIRSGLVGRALRYVVDPRTPLRLPAPPVVQPRKDLDPAVVLAQFVELQTLLRTLLDRLIYYDWNTTQLSTLFGNWLKIRLGDALLMLVAHTERHLNQARRVVADARFPAAL